MSELMESKYYISALAAAAVHPESFDMEKLCHDVAQTLEEALLEIDRLRAGRKELADRAFCAGRSKVSFVSWWAEHEKE